MNKISLYINTITQPITQYENHICEPIDISTPAIIQDVPNCSCSHVVVGNVLDYLEDKSFLKIAVQKLAYEGEIFIYGVDLSLKI